jgi:pimeloyl-ACP methyl ester carboxylesterase
VFLGPLGNPTWWFLYRHIVSGLRDRFRCIALDYPGFGLSTAPPGYGITVSEHARVVQGFVEQLNLRDVTLMVQDWGGPIGLWVATRQPERFRAFVIGNTWAWPVTNERDFVWFSKILGSDAVGGLLVKRAEIFVNLFMRGGIRRKKLSLAERAMFKRPHPTAQSRVPVHLLPREILGGPRPASRHRPQLGPGQRQTGPDRVGRQGPGLSRAATASVGTDLPESPDRDPPRRGALHPGRRTGGIRGGCQGFGGQASELDDVTVMGRLAPTWAAAIAGVPSIALSAVW